MKIVELPNTEIMRRFLNGLNSKPECRGYMIYGNVVYLPDACKPFVGDLGLDVEVHYPAVGDREVQRFMAFLSIVAEWADVSLDEVLGVLASCLEGMLEAKPLLEAMGRLGVEKGKKCGWGLRRNVKRAFKEFWVEGNSTRSCRYTVEDFMLLILKVWGATERATDN